MKKCAVILANGFEEIEAISVVDILRRGGIQVEIMSTSDYQLTGAHGITILADELFDYYGCTNFDGILFAGGMENARSLASNTEVINLIDYFYDNDKLVGAICASPSLVLSKSKLYGFCRLTCYPDQSLIESINDAYEDSSVVVSNNVITSKCPGTAIDFALEILKYFGIDYIDVSNGLMGK